MLAKIRRMHFRDHIPLREIARRTGLSRNTLRHWLRQKDVVEPQYKKREVKSVVDPWAEQLAQWLQATPIANLGLYGRLSAQWASKNLDSSESFLLGGPNGVRAYPVGEGNGDEGQLVQLEARYRIGMAEPYFFYDTGKVRINADNGRLAAPLADNTRSIAGAGLGVRYGNGPITLDAALAWRTHGGRPNSDTRDDKPRGWVSLIWRF